MNMKQPELGRKIAELRKAQGLTQDELVEKCNLSVRTLQRIESGDVMPRSYTIKIIFSALGYIDLSNGLPDELRKEFNNHEQSGQTNKNQIGLINLKTYSMNKSAVLFFLLVTTCIVILFLGLSSNSFNKVSKDDLIGTWQICNRSTGQLDTCYGGHYGLIRYKIITPAKFMNVDILPGKKIMFGAFSGAYDIRMDVYTESIELTGPYYDRYLGQKNDFKITLQGDILYIKGINNPFDEMWRRVKE